MRVGWAFTFAAATQLSPPAELLSLFNSLLGLVQR
jgi:hypothetical protein